MNTLHRDIEEAESAATRLRQELDYLREQERVAQARLQQAERRLAALRQQEWDHREAQRAARDRQDEVGIQGDGGVWEEGCGMEVAGRGV